MLSSFSVTTDLHIIFSQEHQCGSYENGIWVNTESPIRYGNNAFLRSDGKVQTMGGFGDAVQHMDSSDESDVVNIGIGSVPGYSIENMTQ